MFKDETILVQLVSYELEICVCFTNQLVKFWGKIKIRAYFFKGRSASCVDIWEV